MKRILFSIFILLCGIVYAGAQETVNDIPVITPDAAKQEQATTTINKRLATKGYRGFVNYTPIIATFINDGISGSISTTHGYQINHHAFVGAGVGFHINLGDEGLGIAIPAYAAFKGNIGERMAQFTYGARVGVSYADYGKLGNETSVHNGVTALAYFNINLGLRLGITRYFAIRLTPEVDLFAGKYNIAGAGLRIGFEF